MSDARCVMLGYGRHSDEFDRTWCGRQQRGHWEGDRYVADYEWVFTDATHALLTARNGSWLTACAKCAAAMRDALRVLAAEGET